MTEIVIQQFGRSAARSGGGSGNADGGGAASTPSSGNQNAFTAMLIVGVLGLAGFVVYQERQAQGGFGGGGGGGGGSSVASAGYAQVPTLSSAELTEKQSSMSVSVGGGSNAEGGATGAYGT